ncbi:MAG: CopD family protein [Chlorobiota bacterium]|nr:MAG: CopD family protein [Chlorobiota bacterium]
MNFLYIKALHIIFIVTWFAGLFYIVRLFIYFAETSKKSEPEKTILQKQYSIMQKRLWYGITYPSAILTLIFGLSLLTFYPEIPRWLWIKLCIVLLLYLYHFTCQLIFSQQQKGIIKYSSNQLRIWNEVATIILVAIVFLVSLKDTISMIKGVLGLIIFSIILMIGIKIYKKFRK